MGFFAFDSSFRIEFNYGLIIYSTGILCAANPNDIHTYKRQSEKKKERECTHTNLRICFYLYKLVYFFMCVHMCVSCVCCVLSIANQLRKASSICCSCFSFPFSLLFQHEHSLYNLNDWDIVVVVIAAFFSL